MITTLLRHEAIRTRGTLGVIAGAAAVITVGGSLLVLAKWPVLAQVGLALALVVIIALAPAVQLALGIDYWRSSYRTNGYLTHALPIRGGTIYAAKALWAVIVTLGALLLTAILAAVLFSANAAASGFDPNPFTALGALLDQAFALFPTWLLITGLVVLVAVYIGWALQLYFAASVGSEEPLNRQGAGGPIIVIAIVYAATQVLSFIGLALIPYGIGATEAGTLDIVPMNVFDAEAVAGGSTMPLGFIPAILLLSAFCIWRTARSWNRRTSLV